VLAFEKCGGGQSPYYLDAHLCGDPWDRGFFYPPVLFAFFRWTRPLPLATSVVLWTEFQMVGWVGVFLVWVKTIARRREPGPRHEVVIFCILLALQYPFVFMLERGNTDIGSILLFSLAAVLFLRGRVAPAGAAAGLAAGFKFWPLMAVVVVTASIAWAGRRVGKWTWLRFGGAAFGAFVLTLLPFPRDARIYVFDIIPSFAKVITPDTEWSHSISTFVGDNYPVFGFILAALLMLSWAWAGARAIERDDAGTAFAGALATATYVARTSYDYNLVSVYPLLLLLFFRAQRTNRWALLVFGLFAIAGDRRLFAIKGAHILTPSLHLTLELAFLLMAALVVGRPDDNPASAAQPQPAD